jgi:lipopolysaccharide biosynthesis glycosyltransferase
MNNAIVYSFHIREDDQKRNGCYRQFLYSLETLRRHNKDIAVKVFVSSSQKLQIKINDANTQLINFNNIFPNSFPKDWIETGHAEWLYHRWINAFRSFKLFDFDNILYIDTDTVFYNDPQKLFDRYGNTEQLWAMPDTEIQLMKKIGLGTGMNDGQVIISSKIYKYSKEIVGYMERYVCDIIENKRESLTEEEHFHLYWLCTQYAIASYFKNINNPIQYFDNKFVIIGDMDEGIEKTDLILHHYFSGNTNRYLPERFW